MSSLNIISSFDISVDKWNACVVQNSNGLIYSRKEYLDTMCDNWSGMIIDDYKAVMPLPWRKKFGIRYFYVPAFVQQLGVIGEIHEPVKLIQALMQFAKYGDIVFNFSNASLIDQLEVNSRTNYILDLSSGYDKLSGVYKKDLQLNLRKAQKEDLHYSVSDDVNSAISVYQDNYQHKLGNVSNEDFENFKTVCFQLHQKGMCLVRQVKNSKHQLLASALLLKDNKRIYNIANATTQMGRQTEANHFLIDAVIKEFSGQQLLFDFEGSDLPGVKSFYEKFGAVDQPYFHYHHNQLPSILRLFKS